MQELGMQDDPKRVQEGEMAGMAAPNDVSAPMPLGFCTLANRYRYCREEVSHATTSPPSKPMEFHGLRKLTEAVYGIRLVNCILLAIQCLQFTVVRPFFLGSRASTPAEAQQIVIDRSVAICIRQLEIFCRRRPD
ncbi:MAG: hypothetical protein KDD78_11970 [Caldilineaceae bacterium]|nr:hypothetical protein [Caldilineaceae bacterium]